MVTAGGDALAAAVAFFYVYPGHPVINMYRIPGTPFYTQPAGPAFFLVHLGPYVRVLDLFAAPWRTAHCQVFYRRTHAGKDVAGHVAQNHKRVAVQYIVGYLD